MKKILVVGGTGTIGRAIVSALSQRHQVIVAGHKGGDVQVDVTQKASIEKMYQSVGRVDAVVSTIGQVHFAPLAEMNEALYQVGLNHKLMGQVNLVILGLPYLNEQGSFTLTSGILNQDPIREGSSAAMVNGALDGFVRGAAIEMPRGIRINIVSPTVLTESVERFGDYFLGYESVPAEKVARAYVKSVEGAQTGQVYSVGY